MLLTLDGREQMGFFAVVRSITLSRVQMSYEQFEALSVKCIPYEMELKACQSFYRLLLRAYPDRCCQFPPATLCSSRLFSSF